MQLRFDGDIIMIMDPLCSMKLERLLSSFKSQKSRTSLTLALGIQIHVSDAKTSVSDIAAIEEIFLYKNLLQSLNRADSLKLLHPHWELKIHVCLSNCKL